MIKESLKILLADDDKGDCLLFKDALEELPVKANLTMVHNGEEVIESLTAEGNELPDVCVFGLEYAPQKRICIVEFYQTQFTITENSSCHFLYLVG
jgi:CheY-like chemotaxis protein